jgi:hypothetical protein
MARQLAGIEVRGCDLVSAAMQTARQATEQRQRVLEVLSREQQIAAAALQISGNSRAVTEQTNSVAQAIDAGTATIEATNRSMTEMVATVTAGTDLMQEFVARMTEVNRIVGEIGGIARQTNLLAINAAIEAAHAGKEGEGFSVIAQEIRELADRAGQSTAEIDEKISRMNLSATSAAAAMRTGRAAAENSVAENGMVQASLQSIREAMHQVQRISAEVTQASQDQIVAAEAATSSVIKVDEMAALSSSQSDAAAEMSLLMVADTLEVMGDVAATRQERSGKHGNSREMTLNILAQVRQQEQTTRAALSMLRDRCLRAGSPQVDGEMQVKGSSLPGLRFGATYAADAATWVDEVHARTQCGATLFVADGDRFVRVATNVKLPDGQRATGTVLNPRGLAMAALREGRSYFGAVYVLGNPYVAEYEPVLSSRGEILGALYVGRPLVWKKKA